MLDRYEPELNCPQITYLRRPIVPNKAQMSQNNFTKTDGNKVSLGICFDFST
jgi:hypothetical protein